MLHDICSKWTKRSWFWSLQPIWLMFGRHNVNITPDSGVFITIFTTCCTFKKLKSIFGVCFRFNKVAPSFLDFHKHMNFVKLAKIRRLNQMTSIFSTEVTVIKVQKLAQVTTVQINFTAKVFSVFSEFETNNFVQVDSPTVSYNVDSTHLEKYNSFNLVLTRI